ncbi:xylose ABC transporter ATP-binding protein [Diplocloster hominis]|uniref:xylose ABC transporter ATP-binding protein n=1 Tax=Diplocloster hominis TaxID=3079010 RepID=UPI0031BA1925
MEDYILEMRDIVKEFSGVKALDHVNFRVRRGEIHALVGENGAGKSTLMKILSGVYYRGTYKGQLIVNGKEQHFSTIKDAENCGIAIIHQELNMVKTMNICENLFLGSEHISHGRIKWSEQYKIAGELLKEVKLDISPTTLVQELGVGKQQLIEIAKALHKKAEILILDEPTSALSEKNTQDLLDLLKELKAKGVTCIYISHKLKEVFSIADTVTILRDGQTICSAPIFEYDEAKMIYHMVGRELTQRFPKKQREPGDVVLEISDWCVQDPDNPERYLIDHVSLKARKGEILGIAGLVGAGRTEFAMSLFGAFAVKGTGIIRIGDKEVKISRPSDAIREGFSYLSEDRKRYGLVLINDLKTNMTLAALKTVSRFGVINNAKEIYETNRYKKELRIKAASMAQKAGSLSGGNQQKVVLAKWLLTQPQILILDEPTKGIDVGAKFEIYEIMNKLVEQGVCVILISSELPEVMGMSDRIYVMSQGRITGELDSREATQEKILTLAAGRQDL